MRIEIEITPRAIEPGRALPPECSGNAGAVAEFLGLVRAEEDGRPIVGIEYEAYSPMAERMMRSIAEELGRRHPCLWVRVSHRVGLVRVGEPAIHVLAAAGHRGPALAMVTELMDRLKQDVPIWKRRLVRPETAPAQPHG